MRKAGRRLAAHIIRSASAVCSLRAEAEALSVSPSAVEHWADEAHPAAMTLGDLLAGRRDFAEAVLVAALSHVRARVPAASLPTEVRVLRVAGQAGRVAGAAAEALADGVIDEVEAQLLERDLVDLGRETEAALRDLKRQGC